MMCPRPQRRPLPVIVFALLVLALLTGMMPTAEAAGNASAQITTAQASWRWPVPGPHLIVRPYIAPQTPYSRGHRGIDIAAAAGAALRAPADGIIHFSGFIVDRGVVSIDHGGGILSSFEPVASRLAEGTIVRRGEQIGAVQSGHCTAPCLHVGVRLHGRYVSPLNYLGGIARSVLLPTRQIR